MLMRKRLKTEFVKAHWVNKNTLEYWPCSAVNATKIQAPTGKCFTKIPVNISLNLEEEEWITGFLDPKTHVITEVAEIGSCNEHRFISTEFQGKLIQIDQLTGKIKELTEITTQDLSLETWEGQMPEFALQIFRQSTINNLTHNHIDLIELMDAFKSARMNDPRPQAERHEWRSKINLPDSQISTLIGGFDWWLVFIKSVTVGIAIKWILNIYL
nr:unnamed protein product [Meloidogyne enterolobii]